MKRLFFTALTVSLFTFLLFLTPVLAGPPLHASGEWFYIPTIVGVKEAGCNTHLTTTEVARWTGTFVGTSDEEGRVIIHCNGNWSFKGTVAFVGTVDGKYGTMTMTANGTRADDQSPWIGHWTITGGTDELEGLRGNGTFNGFGAPGPGFEGVVDYEGNYHFESN